VEHLGDLGVHVHHRVREAVHVARVVKVVVGHDQRADVCGTHAKPRLEQREWIDVLRQREGVRERQVVEAGVDQDPRLLAVPYRVQQPPKAHGNVWVAVDEDIILREAARAVGNRVHGQQRRCRAVLGAVLQWPQQ